MAERRMIRRDLWEDERFNSLSLPSRLLYVAMQTIADDEGCFRANADYWKRTVFHSMNFSLNRVKKMMEEIAKTGLIVVGQSSEGIAAYIPKWHEMQSLRADRSKKSKFSDLLVANGLTPRFGVTAEDKGSEENISQESGSREKILEHLAIIREGLAKKVKL